MKDRNGTNENIVGWSDFYTVKLYKYDMSKMNNFVKVFLCRFVFQHCLPQQSSIQHLQLVFQRKSSTRLSKHQRVFHHHWQRMNKDTKIFNWPAGLKVSKIQMDVFYRFSWEGEHRKC